MESDVRKLLVNKIAKNIYDALLNKRSNEPWQHLVSSGNNNSDDSLMASILESVHGTLGGDESNGFEERRRSGRYVPIPLTVEELSSSRESSIVPKYQDPTPNGSKHQAQSAKHQAPSPKSQNPSPTYQAPSPKYQAPSPKYQAPSPKHQAPGPKSQVPNQAKSFTSPPKSSKKNGVRWATMPEESDVVVDEDCCKEFDELYYSSVVTSHKKTDRGVISRPR